MLRKFILHIIIALCLCVSSCLTVHAGINGQDGDPSSNIGDASGNPVYWTKTSDGVRVSVISRETGKRVGPVYNWTNFNFNRTDAKFEDLYYASNCKLDYIQGESVQLVKEGGCNVKYPENFIRIFSSNGKDRYFDGVKKYFCDKGRAEEIANQSGIPYNDLVDNSKYVVMLEPIAFFKIHKRLTLLSSTEAAMLNSSGTLQGQIYKWVHSVTHQNMPVSMFLQRPDLGIPANGSSPDRSGGEYSDNKIISTMGVALLSGAQMTGDLGPKEYTFYTDTDVIVSSEVQNFVSDQYDPGNPLEVVFESSSGTFKHSDMNLPGNETRMAWFQWHTPSSTDDVVFNVSANGDGIAVNEKITCHIINKPQGNEPPDPQGRDTSGMFSLSKTPPAASPSDTHNWNDWRASGSPEAGYSLTEVTYTAQLNPSLAITPDEELPDSISVKRFADNILRSGYGINCTFGNIVSGSYPERSVTPAQLAIAAFPEFGYNYENNRRILIGTTALTFAPNSSSQNKDRPVHFTPVWYPDNTDYVVSVRAESAWTPMGELKAVVNSNNIDIEGSVFDDWFVQRSR